MQTLPSNTQIPSSTAFAQNGDRSTIAVSSDRQMNWSSGFPEIFSRLLSDGGKYVKREDMNAILYALSNEALYRQWGGLVSYNATVANTIFGYPVGATLVFKNPSSGVLSFIESQVANNQVVPTISTIDTKTDINGQYADNGVVRWKTVLSNQGMTVPYINVPLLTPMWFDHKVYDLSAWIESVMVYDTSNNWGWVSAANAVKVFEHLVGEISAATATTETIGGITISYLQADDGHKIVIADGMAIQNNVWQQASTTVDDIFAAVGVAWFYVVDRTNKCFRLPRTKFQSFALGDTVSVPVVGTGMTLGMTNGTINFGLGGNGAGYNSGIGGTSNYGAPVGTGIGGRVGFDVGIGVTKDPTKSGLIASGNLTSNTGANNFYLYFSTADYSYNTGGGGVGGGVIDGTLLQEVTTWTGQIIPTPQKIYTVKHDCALGIMEELAYVNVWDVSYYLDAECTLPIFRHPDNGTVATETWGTLVPLKSGCEIYVREEGSAVTPTRTIKFYEYALNSLAPQIAMPDYNSTDAQTIDTTQFTAPENGWICCNPTWFLVNIYINNVLVSRAMAQVAGGNFSWSGTIVPISKGDVATFSSADGLTFIPCKTVQQSNPPVYITSTQYYEDTGYWYRLYSDGFCEQGGPQGVPVGGGGSGALVTLPIPYKNTLYTVVTGGAGIYQYPSPTYKQTTGFQMSGQCSWHTMGYTS